jgi:hypothetical protein
VALKDRTVLSPQLFEGHEVSGHLEMLLYPDVRCENGPLEPTRQVDLRVAEDIFEVTFYWHTRASPLYSERLAHDLKKTQLAITEVDSECVSYLVRWLATGEPEFKTGRSEGKGFWKTILGR